MNLISADFNIVGCYLADDTPTKLYVDHGFQIDDFPGLSSRVIVACTTNYTFLSSIIDNWKINKLIKNYAHDKELHTSHIFQVYKGCAIYNGVCLAGNEVIDTFLLDKKEAYLRHLRLV
ncbi:hypothetical protein Ciccas_000396 [Cichlidogyrus casuarinus]|uniref:Uncharacterized protein n=1 Tax=Cichlidogyrus casuarinus TaxID=1844966 RepID=A0ABD2QN03_9PLAT